MMLWYGTEQHASNNHCTVFPTQNAFELYLHKEIESLNKVPKNSEKPVTAAI
jgi:hypothetical protein